jgi:ribonuclease P protein component
VPEEKGPLCFAELRKEKNAVKFTVSLKENRVFRRLYAKGQSAVAPAMVLYCRRNGRKENRFGITAGTKLGHAVARNKVRRRLREIYRLHEDQLLPGYDIVVVARVRAVHSKYGELDKQFLRLAKKLRLLRPQDGEEQP